MLSGCNLSIRSIIQYIVRLGVWGTCHNVPLNYFDDEYIVHCGGVVDVRIGAITAYCNTCMVANS